MPADSFPAPLRGREILASLKRAKREGVMGLPTGLASLNRLTGGLPLEGGLVIVSAPKRQAERALLRTFAAAVGRKRTVASFLQRPPSQGRDPIATLDRKIRRAAEAAPPGKPLALVVLGCLQSLAPAGEIGGAKAAERAFEAVTRRLKWLAGTHGLTIAALARHNPGSRLRLGQAAAPAGRDSHAEEAAMLHADLVLRLLPGERSSRWTLDIAKNRLGPPGSVPVALRGRKFREHSLPSAGPASGR